MDSKSEVEKTNRNGNCGIENVTLKTEQVEKKRKFLFWDLGHKKVIIIDKVFDSSGKIILERKSAFIQTMDSYEDIRFRRIKLVDGEIWVFRYNRKPENEFIERYNNCGKYIGKRKWKSGDYYQDVEKTNDNNAYN
jgi:hypothetical protein